MVFIAALIFIEKMGTLEQLCLRAPKSLIWQLLYSVRDLVSSRA